MASALFAGRSSPAASRTPRCARPPHTTSCSPIFWRGPCGCSRRRSRRSSARTATPSSPACFLLMFPACWHPGGLKGLISPSGSSSKAGRASDYGGEIGSRRRLGLSRFCRETGLRPNAWARVENAMARVPVGVGPKLPQIVVLFGATGDLAHKKLLPGLFHLVSAGFISKCRIIGVSLDALDAEKFRTLARDAVFEQHAHHPKKEAWPAFEALLDYVPIAAGAGALKEAVDKAEKSFVEEAQRVHYMSVPPNAALSAIKMLSEAQLAGGSRIIMEKPFGTDLESAVALNDALHKVFAEDQIFRIDHFLGKEPAQNILAFRFANGLFEPIWNRNFIDHVQIDVPETLGLDKRAGFYETVGAFRDMVVTHLFQILAFMAMEPPTSLEPGPISEEKNKVF